MLTLTINGNTPEELLSNLETLLKSQQGASTQNHQPEPFPAQPTARTTSSVAPMAQAPVLTAPVLPANPTPSATVPIVATPTMISPSSLAPSVVPTAPTGVPIAPVPTYTLDQLARAGATLAQSGKMEQALALLAKYGVQTVNQLQPDQYGAFATELRALGTQV